MPNKAFLPQTHLIHYAPKTQDTRSVFPEMEGYPSSLGSSFVIEIQTLSFGFKF